MIKSLIFSGKWTYQNMNVLGFLKKIVPVVENINRSFHVGETNFMRKGILHPHGFPMDWAIRAAIPSIDKYTHQPLPRVRTGGRGPDGRVELKHVCAGLKRPHFMVNKFRGGLCNGSESVISEKILYIHKNFWRPELIALVARGLEKRWIYATVTMKVGDIVNSYGKLGKIVAKPIPGDAYPIGCLPVGTNICQIERVPGEGAYYAIKAGSQGLLTQKNMDNSCIVQVGKRYFKISSGCAAVAGQMSNPDHYKERFTKFGQKKWLGIKQRSGLKQKKTGRFGRKIKPIAKPMDFSIKNIGNKKVRLYYTKPGLTPARRQQGTFDKPRHIKPFPVEEGETHPHFNWCSWSRVR